MPPPANLLRGATKSPRHKLLAASPHRVVTATPPQSAFVPKKLSMWGNDRYGDCVSAEEAFAKACYQPEIFIPENTVISWAEAGGFLNGANLVEVMEKMQRQGFKDGGGTYNDGPYSSVDYSNQAVLQNALSLGPVKIAIDASALPENSGVSQGWYALPGGNYPNTDHCVSLSGYGPAGWLYSQLGVALPPTIPSGQPGYLLFTWSTIGFVTHAWLMSTCTESWLRNPTTLIVGPGPTPPPGPGPTPPPDVLWRFKMPYRVRKGQTFSLVAGADLARGEVYAVSAAAPRGTGPEPPEPLEPIAPEPD